MGPALAFPAVMLFSASFQLAFAASTLEIAFPRSWKTWMSDCAVNVCPPSVNDPFGECFSVPAMRSRTRCAIVTLVTLCVLMIDVSFLKAAGEAGHAPMRAGCRDDVLH